MFEEFRQAAGYVVGYGAGAYLERVLQALGPVEYIVLAVPPLILVASVLAWRAVRGFNDRASP